MLSLEKLFDGLDISVEPFALCHVRGTQPLDLGRRDQATIHLTLAGRGRIILSGGREIAVQENTVLIVPAGCSHRLASQAGRPDGALAAPRCRSLGPGWQALWAGRGDDPGVVLACGALHATYHRTHGLFDYLTAPLVEHLEGGDPLQQSLLSLLDEQHSPQPGARAMCQVLMRQTLILLLRRYFSGGESRAAWLDALEDDRLGRAVAAIFEDPGAPHSLPRLAEMAGMSRSAFAERFSQNFQRGPMDLVKEVRLRQAAQLLEHGDTPIKLLAHRVGYQSRSQFSRAFKDFFGVSPGEYRIGAQAGARSGPTDHRRRGTSTV
jgi:AraC-like DNA-binding protein